MGFPRAKIVDLGDVKIATYQRGADDAPPILLFHGWPEIAYSWKHQMEPLAAAGYRVIAIDVRGFGYSSAPKEIDAYHITKIVGDIEGVMDKLGIREAVIAGHDWGGIIVWHAARMIEERVRGVISICTPHMQYPPANPIDIFRHRHGEDHYFVAFQEEGIAEGLFDSDVLALFKMLFRKMGADTKPSSEMFHMLTAFKAFIAAGQPRLSEPVMSLEDLQVYAGAYTHSGFHGGVNLYRNTGTNWEHDKKLSQDIEQPSLMISTDQDLYLPPEMADPMVDMVADLERHTVKNCGHWAMWEQPEAINKIMIEWLQRKMGLRFY